MARYEKGEFVLVPNKKAALLLPDGVFKVYVALLSHADAEGSCFPSIPTIAKETGKSETAVKTALKEMRESGLVEVVRRKRPDGSASSNRYDLQLLSTLGQNPTHPGSESAPRELNSLKSLPKGKGADAPGAPKEEENPILREYWKVIRMYSLATPNRSHIKKWADDLVQTHKRVVALAYLVRLQERDLRQERKSQEFVPQLATAYDVYAKSTKVIDYYTRTKPARDPRSYE